MDNLSDIERIAKQREIEQRKMERILSKSKAKLEKIGERQHALLEKEQRIIEVKSTDKND